MISLVEEVGVIDTRELGLIFPSKGETLSKIPGKMEKLGKFSC